VNEVSVCKRASDVACVRVRWQSRNALFEQRMAASKASVIRLARPAVMDTLVRVMESIAPRKLAGTWDNVGELISPSGAKEYKTPA
jgi:transposase